MPRSLTPHPSWATSQPATRASRACEYPVTTPLNHPSYSYRSKLGKWQAQVLLADTDPFGKKRWSYLHMGTYLDDYSAAVAGDMARVLLGIQPLNFPVEHFDADPVLNQLGDVSTYVPLRLPLAHAVMHWAPTGFLERSGSLRCAMR